MGGAPQASGVLRWWVGRERSAMTSVTIGCNRDLAEQHFDSNFVTLLQLRDDAKILESRRVTFYVTAGGQFTQQPAHNFAAARFGQHVGKANVVGLGE